MYTIMKKHEKEGTLSHAQAYLPLSKGTTLPVFDTKQAAKAWAKKVWGSLRHIAIVPLSL